MRIRYLFAIACVLVAGLPANGLAQMMVDVGPGQTIADGTVFADGATVNVDGGRIGFGVDLSNGVLNINSGEVGFNASGVSSQGIGQGFTNTNNLINLTGGSVGGFFQLVESTTLNISGGEIESFGLFDAGTTVNISGGTVTRFPDAFAGEVNISGGDVFAVRIFSGATLNLFGTEFSVDGNPIALLPGDSDTVDFNDFTATSTLTATLQDGSLFETTLGPVGAFFGTAPGGFDNGAALVLNRVVVASVPEPSAIALLSLAGFGLLTRRRRKFD